MLGVAPEPHLVVQPADLEAIVRRKDHEPRRALRPRDAPVRPGEGGDVFRLRAHGDELLHAV